SRRGWAGGTGPREKNLFVGDAKPAGQARRLLNLCQGLFVAMRLSLAADFACRTMEAMEIDLNSDLGEGCGHDAEIIPLVTSANISCGCHAGDIYTAAEALMLARQHGVAVGAHP